MSNLAIVTPCYNEENGIRSFLKSLEGNLRETDQPVSVIVVDDCSQDGTASILKSFQFETPSVALHILRLKFNMGHQQAIYQGLLYANELNAARVIVMDSDGEDDPSAIPLLIKNEPSDIVEVIRGKRREGFTFRILYVFYKMIFFAVTGKKMNFGNYSMISRSVLERITITSFIHYPAYLLKLKSSRTSIKVDRGKRIHGKSKMGLNGLFLYSFRSFVEFGEDLLMLFLKLFGFVIIVITILLADVLYQKFIAHTAIAGWASTVILSLVTIAILCLGFFFIGILLVNLNHQQNNKSLKNLYDVIRGAP